ncbi:uncharacterized protein LOC135693499 isoform X3 [Rhopilema esculentum]|uniref:uncharacterized protein LOC135693499 isoform X3 n=1 Tax=Rhopilema esculentum TaxID=499914 RepID=UPI0031E34924
MDSNLTSKEDLWIPEDSLVAMIQHMTIHLQKRRQTRKTLKDGLSPQNNKDLPMEQAEVSSDEESDGDNRGVGEHIDADMESEPEKEDGHAGKRRVGKRSRWGKEESSVVLKHYADKIKKGVLPGKSDATQLIAESAVLKNRTWQNVKDFVQNHIAKAKRLSSKSVIGNL